MMNNKEIEYTARPIPGDYEGRAPLSQVCRAF